MPHSLRGDIPSRAAPDGGGVLLISTRSTRSGLVPDRLVLLGGFVIYLMGSADTALPGPGL